MKLRPTVTTPVVVRFSRVVCSSSTGLRMCDGLARPLVLAFPRLGCVTKISRRRAEVRTFPTSAECQRMCPTTSPAPLRPSPPSSANRRLSWLLAVGVFLHRKPTLNAVWGRNCNEQRLRRQAQVSGPVRERRSSPPDSPPATDSGRHRVFPASGKELYQGTPTTENLVENRFCRFSDVQRCEFICRFSIAVKSFRFLCVFLYVLAFLTSRSSPPEDLKIRLTGLLLPRPLGSSSRASQASAHRALIFLRAFEAKTSPSDTRHIFFCAAGNQ